MTRAAIDFNDAAISVVLAGGLISKENGYACAAGSQLFFGAEAQRQSRLRRHDSSNRHWRELSEAALPRPIGGCRTSADLVQAHLRHLRRMLPGTCDDLVAAVPSYWTPQQLGLLLAMARDAGLPLSGFVDTAVAASRRPYPGQTLWNLDLTLHDVELRRMIQNGDVGRGDGQRYDWLSTELLDRACAQSIVGAFLRTSRFDPFHDAESEQDICNRLAGWLEALRTRDSLEISVKFRGNEFTARVRAAEVRASVAQAMEKPVQRLRTLIAADDTAVLQVPDRLGDYPGALEALGNVANCQFVALEPAAPAAGALRLPATPGSVAVPLATRLPWDRPAAGPAGVANTAMSPAVAVTCPTHIVHAGRAYRLGAVEFGLGSEVADTEFGLRLPATVQALSRRHCGVRVENGRVLVHDYSRHGTFLNGHQIEGSAVLHAGDVLRIGQPGVELVLVAEVQDRATPA